MSFITGVGLTSYGKHEGSSSLDSMSKAAELAIADAGLTRAHALTQPGAQFHEPITVADVMASKPGAMPLKLLDCCPVSDGGAAFVVSRQPTSATGIRVRGCAQAHTHQHVTAAPGLS